MTNSELRTIALAVKSRVVEIHNTIAPAAAEVETWVLNAIDSSLPTIGAVKAALLAYEAFEKPSLLLYDEVRALKALSDEATALPDPNAGHSHVVTWNDVTSKPSTFPPDTHVHTVQWADVQGKQATYPPSEHSHNIAWGEVTGKPTNLIKAAQVNWTGTGTASRDISIPFAMAWGEIRSPGQAGINGRLSGGYLIQDGIATAAFTATASTLSLSLATLNTLNKYYNLILFGEV